MGYFFQDGYTSFKVNFVLEFCHSEIFSYPKASFPRVIENVNTRVENIDNTARLLGCQGWGMAIIVYSRDIANGHGYESFEVKLLRKMEDNYCVLISSQLQHSFQKGREGM